MTRRDHTRAFALAILSAAACKGDVGPSSNAVTAPPLRGAIFTTLVDGSRVDANIYEAKTDVYLDGGPSSQAPSGAGALPEGDYYFQVTDPSGKDLLSSDHISCRRIHVNADGVIDQVYPGTNYVLEGGTWTAEPCQHAQGEDSDHAELGAITVQLFPYDDTPNPGGEYKVWATPVENYTGDASFVPSGVDDAVNGENWAPGNAHGFAPNASKTDNFKVRQPAPPPPPDAGVPAPDAAPPPPPAPDAAPPPPPAPDAAPPPPPDAAPPPPAPDACLPPAPVCGNGIVETGEICDDGDLDDFDGCTRACVPGAVCGDGQVTAPEECDDGNRIDGDCCSANCKITSGVCPG